LLATLSTIDYGVLGLYLAAMLAMGLYFSGRQKDTAEFFLGSRSFSWFPLGISLMATLISALTYTGLPGQAYQQGLKCWIIPASFWIIMPLVIGVVIPIYRGLGLYSLYEYLEFRFDSRVRLTASLIFVVWRLLWLGGVIYAPVKVLTIAAGWQGIPDWWLIVLLGAVTTLYTFLGGMRAVIWTDVVQGLAMLFGVVVVIVGVWWQLDGGAERVHEIAAGLGRTQVADLRFNWTDQWSLWGALPHWVLANLSFYMADQITAQRFLSAKSVNAARTSFVINTLGLSFLLPALIYAGVCLLAFYYDHPRELNPAWVVNLDGQTRQPLAGEDGQPLLDANNPAHEVRWETIDRLVAERRLLQPNNKEPFTSTAELIDAETNRVLVERLAMRKPPAGKFNGEWIVRRDAPEQMLPQFIADHLPWGAAGLILAALLAASMSSIDSGLNSICSLLVMDFHRRYGWAKGWLARRVNKEPGELTEADELRLAQPLTLFIGLAATVFAIGVSQIADIFTIMVSVANTFGAPLLAVFLLGMLTRRTTAPAAFLATVLGGLFTLGITIYGKLVAGGSLGPQAFAFADIWNVIFGVAFTLAVGYVLSFFVGQRKSSAELRGLVAGCGTLGIRATDEVTPIISVQEDPTDIRWRL
jgi:sodium-dependent multivitamin transporter 6